MELRRIRLMIGEKMPVSSLLPRLIFRGGETKSGKARHRIGMKY